MSAWPIGIGIGCAMILLAAGAAFWLHGYRRDLTRMLGPLPECPWCTGKRYALPADCDCTERCGRSYCMRLAETAP
jgi:hypothetical protein